MSKAHIVVIDDNESNLKLASMLLSKHGFQVETACDGLSGLKLIYAAQPDIVLMDIQLPQLDGIALAQQLRNDPKTENLVIVALTAYAMHGDMERFLTSGFDAYISKPIDIYTMPITLERLLQKHRAVQASS